jgi:MocE subfamily Rieske [2Fe-2S] domain protein
MVTSALIRRPAREGDRDYSLTGKDARAARAIGLADAQWYRPPIDPDRLRELMTRTNVRAARDTVAWLVLIAGFGTVAFVSLGTWWMLPAFMAYGALYGGAADPRWHENGHGTAFRSRAPNEVVYYLASFMLLREPTMWRWSHVRHHSDTIIVGLDPEISFPRPFRLRTVLPNYLHLINGPVLIWRMVRHATGHIDAATREFVPDDELPRVKWEARGFVGLLLAVVVWSVAARTIVPLLYVGLPSFYGVWLLWFFAITQHAGLREDVLDHRYITRSVRMNPVFRFLYLNMNYHLEHHLFPSVPYHALPQLHEEIKEYLPEASPSTWAAYREIIGALRMQRRDPDWEIPDRRVPDDVPTATRAPTVPQPEVLTASGGVVSASRTDLGSADMVQPGKVMRLDIDGRTFALYRQTTDSYALSDGLCTHGQTHLADGHLSDCVIECPKHNGRFDLRTGEAIRRPARLPLTMYPVEVVDGRLLADLTRCPAPGPVLAASPSTAPAKSS